MTSNLAHPFERATRLASVTNSCPTPCDRRSGQTYNSGMIPKRPSAYSARHSERASNPATYPPSLANTRVYVQPPCQACVRASVAATDNTHDRVLMLAIISCSKSPTNLAMAGASDSSAVAI